MPEQSHASYYPQISGDLVSRVNLFMWVREFLRNCDFEKGYYMEFGVLNGESIIDAYRQLRGHLTHVYGFDSFLGLPVLTDDDEIAGEKMPAYREGNFQSLDKVSVAKVIQSNCRIPEDKLTLIEGFFEDSLPAFDAQLLNDKGPLLCCYIDCNLFSSTKIVLDFIEDKVVEGSWLFFDDYWCNRGSPKLGQRRAISEWLANSSRVGLSDYGNFRGFGKAFIVYEK